MGEQNDFVEYIMEYIKFRHLRRFLRAFDAPKEIRRDSYRRILQYKNMYKGKRCFIIGNGPSLKASDLDMLKEEITFASNRIYKIFPQTDWRPTFYCAQDNNVSVEMGEEVDEPINSSRQAFFRLQGYDRTKEIYNQHPEIIYVPIWHIGVRSHKVYFSKTADRYIMDGNTVTYMAMELAAYMGFSEMILLGVDHSFPFEKEDGKVKVIDTNIVAHFYETVEDNQGEKAYERRTSLKSYVTKAYQAAEDYSRKTKSFRIYNATRGGKLEVFERISLEEVLGLKE